jgi:hypothetical protein
VLSNVITLHNGVTRNNIEMLIDGENWWKAYFAAW